MLGLKGPLLYGAIGLAALLAISVGVNTWQYHVNGELAQSLGAARGAMGVCVSANLSQSQAVTELQGANRALAEQCTLSEEAKALAAEAKAYSAAVQSLSAILAERRKQDEQRPDCLKLLAVDLAAACPATAASLRQLAAHSGAGANGGGISPSGSADTGRADEGLRTAMRDGGGVSVSGPGDASDR